MSKSARRILFFPLFVILLSVQSGCVYLKHHAAKNQSQVPPPQVAQLK